MKLTKIFIEFYNNEKASGFILILCTVVSMILANSPAQDQYIAIWHFTIAGSSVVHWINDGLMAIFFLLIGLELEREIYRGELSNFRTASFPVMAAIGGMIVPAAVYWIFNFGSATQSGAGIPMATDIAFALGILSLLGKRVPPSLKIFLAALAVIDDLGAIIVIAIFYTGQIIWMNLAAALSIFLLLLLMNRMHFRTLLPYLAGGIIMWYFMLHSGVHATISGVLLAFAIPFNSEDKKSPSYSLQHFLHKPVAFLVLPLFALANTSVVIGSNWLEGLLHANSLGIMAGLIFGKPVGIVLFSFIAVYSGLSILPGKVNWKHLIGIGLLGGIGFTMSIFITLLAFEQEELITISKIAILLASLTSGALGYFWLRMTLPHASHEINHESKS